MLLRVIAELAVELRMRAELGIEDARRARVCAGKVRCQAIADSKGPFRIPTEKMEGGTRDAAAGGVPVVPGPIAIGAIEVEHHVVDEVRNVQILTQIGVASIGANASI